MQAGQGDRAIADEAQRELGERERLDVIGAAAALEGGLRGVARARGGRDLLDERGERRDERGDPLERAVVDRVAVVAVRELDARAERAGERATGERAAREDGVLVGEGGGAAGADREGDRDRGEPGLVGEGGEVRIVDGGGVAEDLALAHEAGARAGELGPGRRLAPRRPERELDEREGVEARRAERGLDALLDVARGEALGEDIALRAAGQRCHEWDTRREDGDVAQAERANRITGEPFGIGLGRDIDEAEAEREGLVKRALDVAHIDAAVGRRGKTHIAAAHDGDRCREELPLSHAREYSARMRLLVGFTCIVMAIGCSDDDKVRRLPDAPPPPDSNVDASDFGPVSLTILQDETPQVGITVLFQNADSSVVSETTTGSDGKASAMMRAGGFVTAVDPFPNTPTGVQETDVRTFAGVKPGDQLRLTQDFGGGNTTVNVTVLLPVDVNASMYYVSTNCQLDFPVFTGGGSGSGAPQASMQLSGCGATTNLLVTALDGNNNVLSSIYKQSVALADNATIDLTQDTFTAAPDVTFSYTNMPANATFVNINPIRATALGTIYFGFVGTGVTAGAATLTTKIPSIANATGVTLSSTNTGSTFHMIGEWGPPASTYSLDYGASVLPDFSGEPTLDIANHKIAWTNDGGGAQPDFVKVNGFLRREGQSFQAWRWEIVAPGTNQAVLPVLPAAQAAFNPVEGDTSNFNATMMKVPGGYDAVRAGILADGGFESVTGIGATGKAQQAEYSQQKGIAKPSTKLLRGIRKR